MSGRCDRCGKLLSYGDMCTVTERRIAADVVEVYLLCRGCLAIVDAAIRMSVDVAKGNLHEDGDDE